MLRTAKSEAPRFGDVVDPRSSVRASRLPVESRAADNNLLLTTRTVDFKIVLVVTVEDFSRVTSDVSAAVLSSFSRKSRSGVKGTEGSSCDDGCSEDVFHEFEVGCLGLIFI